MPTIGSVGIIPTYAKGHRRVIKVPIERRKKSNKMKMSRKYNYR